MATFLFLSQLNGSSRMGRQPPRPGVDDLGRKVGVQLSDLQWISLCVRRRVSLRNEIRSSSASKFSSDSERATTAVGRVVVSTGEASSLLAVRGTVGTEPSDRYQSSGSRKKTGLRSFSHRSTLWVDSNPFCWRPARLRLAAREVRLSASRSVSDSLVLRLRQAAAAAAVAAAASLVVGDIPPLLYSPPIALPSARGRRSGLERLSVGSSSSLASSGASAEVLSILITSRLVWLPTVKKGINTVGQLGNFSLHC